MRSDQGMSSNTVPATECAEVAEHLRDACDGALESTLACCLRISRDHLDDDEFVMLAITALGAWGQFRVEVRSSGWFLRSGGRFGRQHGFQIDMPLTDRMRTFDLLYGLADTQLGGSVLERLKLRDLTT